MLRRLPAPSATALGYRVSGETALAAMILGAPLVGVAAGLVWGARAGLMAGIGVAVGAAALANREIQPPG